MSYTKSFRISNGDCDKNGVLRPSALLSMLQEATTEHYRLLGAGREECLSRGILWMITHWYLRIRRMPCEGESVTLETWPGKTRYVFFPRYFRLTDSTGEIVTDAVAQWVLVGAESRSLLLPQSCGISVPQETKGCELSMPPKQLSPAAAPVGSFTVLPEYIDGNGHMNNVRYLDAVEPFLRSDAFASLRELRIEYHAELLCGDTAEVRMAEQNGYYLIEGYGGALAFRMELNCATINEI